MLVADAGADEDATTDPFQITTGGVLQLKAAQYLNSDIFNQYK